MRQRSGAAVEDALHVVKHGQNHLVLFTDLMKIEAAGEVAEEGFIEGWCIVWHIFYY